MSARSGPLEAQVARADDTCYNLLVRALRAGQLNLLMEVPPGFAQLADPYDPAANERYRMLERPPLHDLSYYQGKLYLYFGITPALVLFGPYAALTGHYLLHKDAVVIFYSVGFLASAGLLWAIWRRYFAEVGLAVIAAGTVALGLASFIPMTLPRCDVYEVAISCGYALMMLALAATWGALHQPRRRGWWLAAASLACGLAVGARPSLLFGAVILLVPVAQAWRERRPIRVWLLAAAAPIALVGLGLMLYNALRFDHPFEFGMRYALASCRMDTAHVLSWHYLGFNSWVYFLAPMHWSARFPFAYDITVPPLPAGHFGAEHPFGVLTNLPLVWLALAAPLAWRGRSTDARSLLRGFLAALAWVFGACALTLGCFFAACDRYQVEFVPALVLLAVVGILGLERTLAGRRIWRLAARTGWGLLLVCSVAFNLLASANRRAGTDADFGNILLGRGQVDEAIVHFRKALAIQPDAADVLANLGGALLMRGQAAEAAASLQEALKLRPGSAQAHNKLGAALLQQGRLDEAILHLRQALTLQPDSAQAHNNLGNALSRQGRLAEALAHFQKTVQLQPGLASAHYSLGGALLQAGRADEAIAHLQRALELQPSLAGAHLHLANALLQQGRADEAIPHFQQALSIQPASAAAHNGLANALLQRGRVAEAVTHYQAAAAALPGNPHLLNNLAWVLATCPDATIRDGARAVPLAQEAERLSGGKDPALLGTLAAAYAETGHYADAVSTAQRALDLAIAQANTTQVETLRARLKLYQSGSPFRDTGLLPQAPPSRGTPSTR